MSSFTHENVVAHPRRGTAILANRLVLGFSRHWLLVITIVLGLYVGLPWLAPVFMRIGWTGGVRRST